MKAAVLTKTGFEIRDVPMPECGADQMQVKLSGCGVCGGEIGAFKKRAQAEERWLGHEGGGVITAVGSEVADFEVGDGVAILGGRYAEYAVIDKGLAVRLASTVEPAWSLGEPIACCVHAMQRCRISGGENVAVVGCGFMGLICMELARHGMGCKWQASDRAASDILSAFPDSGCLQGYRCAKARFNQGSHRFG